MATTFYTVDGGDEQAYAGAFAVSGEGAHTLTFYSTDNAGNVQATQTLTIDIDTVKPTTTKSLTGTAGTNGWYVSPVTVTLTATDAAPRSGVATTYYQINGGTLTTYTGDFVVSMEGETTVTFYSVDVAGNVESQGSVSFKIDTVDPATTATRSNTPTASRPARTASSGSADPATSPCTTTSAVWT